MKNQQVEQFVKAPILVDIWTLNGVKYSTNRIGYTAKRRQKNAEKSRGSKVFHHKKNRPPHQQVDQRRNDPRRIHPGQFQNHTCDCHTPQNGTKTIPCWLRQKNHAERRIASGDQHIDHAVVNLSQKLFHPVSGYTPTPKVIHRAGRIQRNQ